MNDVRRPPAREGEALVVREVVVLSLVAKGMSDPEIAALLGVTEDQARWLVRRVRAKLGAVDRAQAVDQGWRRGYLGMWRIGVDYTTRRTNGKRVLLSSVEDMLQ